jgi:hypothetical protein
MDRAWELNASVTPPSIPSLEIGYPKDTGPATQPGAWWFHMVTEELRACITQAGMTPSASVLTQLRDAIGIIAKQSVTTGAATPVRMVDTVGVTLSFAQVVDGVAVVTGDRILRSVSPADPTNGVYIANTSGGWTRSTDFPAGSSMSEGMLFSIAEGNNNKNTIWQMAEVSGETATIGTTAIVFRNITDSLNAKLSQYLLASAAAATYAPINAPAFTGALTLNNYTAGAVPYLNGSKVLVSDASFTYDGTNLTATGRINAAAFAPTSSTIPVAGMYLPAANTLAFSTNSVRVGSINPQGYFAIGTVSAVFQAQVTGAGQSSAAFADGGAVGGMLLLQDSNATAGSGGGLVLGTSLGAASPFATIKGLLTDTGTGKVGHIGFGVRTLVTDATLTEAMRLTSTRNLLVGTTIDTLSSSAGNIVVGGKMYAGQAIGISAGTAGQVQAIGGASTTWYNAHLRNDGTNAQLLSSTAQTSAALSVDVAANAFRPFSWNLSTGAVTIDGTGVGANFGGNVTLVAPGGADNSAKAVTSAWVNTKLASFAPATVGSNNILRSNGSGGFSNVTIGSGLALDGAGNLSVTIAGSSGGTVTSVNASVPSFLTVSGGPITGAGTLAIGFSGTALPVANGGTGSTTATGTGSVVLAVSPTLTTPNIGTPSAGVLTNATGLPLTTGVTGTLPVANGGTGVTSSTGTGSNVLSTNPVLITPNLGTPSAITLTNGTGLPLGTGVTGQLGVTNGGTGLATIAANSAIYSTTLNTIVAGTLPVLAGGTGVTTATGTGNNVLSNSPTLVTPNLGTPASGDLSNCINFPAASLTGNLAIANFNGGASANASTFWRGDGVWAAPAGGGTVINTSGALLANSVVLGAGSTDTKVVNGITTDGISNLNLGVAGTSVGGVTFANATSGTITLQPVTGALGTVVLSLPAATDRLVGRDTVDILTNKTINGASNSITNVPLGTAVTGVLPVANGGTGVTTKTGTGSVVLSNNATLVSPQLGTPSSGSLVNCTNFPVSELTGAGAGILTFLTTPNSTNLAAAVTDETGSGSLVFATNPNLVTPNLGTPSAGNLVNCTGFPATGLSGLGAGVAAWLAVPSSANLLTAMTTKTGTGNLVFATSPILVTPNLGTPSAGTLTNCTGLPLTTGVTGVLPIANGGTGSATQNFIDLTTDQTAAGAKTFTGHCGFGSANPSAAWKFFAQGSGSTPAGVFAAGVTAVDVIGQFAGMNLILFEFGTPSSKSVAGGIILGAGGTSVAYNTTSDYRLKTSVERLDGDVAVNMVKAMKPSTYQWKNDTDKNIDIGFIAHELQETAPTVVHGKKDDVNEDGSIKPQGVDYSKLTPILTAALQSTIEKLEVAMKRIGDMEELLKAHGLMTE